MVPPNGLRYHFSVDDVFDALIEVSDRGIELFEHPFFAFLEQVHARFETNIDLYLFLQQRVDGRPRHLGQVSATHLDAFQQAAWMRFGPHALDYETPPHAQSAAELQQTFDAIYAEIERFAGPGKNSRWVRLHYFSEPLESSDYLSQRGVESLLLTDKPAVSYRLPEEDRSRLSRKGIVRHGRIDLRRSHFRMENLAAEAASGPRDMTPTFDGILTASGYLSLFTHEVDLAREEVRKKTLECLDYASTRRIASL